MTPERKVSAKSTLEPPSSVMYREERDRLPSDLQPIFDSLVESYRYHALVHHHQPFVSYKVLSALVREGWSRG